MERRHHPDLCGKKFLTVIVVAGSFRFPKDQVDAALEPMKRMIDASRSEAGCIEYAYAHDVCDPGLFRVYEVWASHQALLEHFASPHMLEWQEEREALGFYERDISAFEAGTRQEI